MRGKLGITILFCSLACSSLAQDQMLAEAFHDFSANRFWQVEEIQFAWSMEGMIQAELNEGINNLLEEKPELAESNFTTVLQKDSSVWQAYYYRGVARKQLRNFSSAQKDLKRSLKLHPDFYEGQVELAKVYHLNHQVAESERAIKNAIQLNKSRGTAYYLRGDINLEQSQVSSAIQNYKDCLKVDSLFHDARIKLAIIDLITKKDDVVALRHLNQVLEYDSLQKTALLFRGILLFEKDKEQCARDLTNLILVSPNNLMAYFLRGTLLTEMGNSNKAFSDFQRVIKATAADDNFFAGKQSWLDKKIDIQNVGSYTLLRVYGLPDEDGEKLKKAYCFIVTGKYDKSIELIESISNPHEEPLAVYLKAVAYEHKGAHTKAYQFYNFALVLDKEIADAYKKRGIYEQEIKQWSKSIKDFTEVLRLNPYSFVTYKMRGVSYYYNNQFDEAISDYTEYLKHDSTNKEIIGYRGMAYQKSNRRLDAYMDFAHSGNTHALNFADMSHLIDSLLVKADTVAALLVLNQFTDLLPYFTEGYVLKCKIFVARNDWEAVEKEAGMALLNARYDAAKKDLAYLLTMQAMAYAGHKREADALTAFNEAIRLDSKNAQAYLERGKVLLALGKSTKAEDDFIKASSLGSDQAKQMLAERNSKKN